MFDFQKLEVYKKAKVFHRDLKLLISEKNLRYPEKDQLYRASFSVALNLAEGSGRFSKRDRRNFFVIARSSVFECVAILDILKDGSNISEAKYSNFETKADELSRMNYGLIRTSDILPWCYHLLITMDMASDCRSHDNRPLTKLKT